MPEMPETPEIQETLEIQEIFEMPDVPEILEGPCGAGHVSDTRDPLDTRGSGTQRCSSYRGRRRYRG